MNTRKYVRQSDNGSRIRERKTSASFNWGKVLVWLFVSVWMFSLGVYVGRKYEPVIFEKDAFMKTLSEFKAKALDKEEKEFQAAFNEEMADTEYDFYDDLKETPETHPMPEAPAGASNSDLLQKLKNGDNDERTEESKATAKIDAAVSEGAKAAEEAAPVTSNKTEETNAEKAAGSEKTETKKQLFTIQVASSKDKESAETVVRRLKSDGHPAYVIEAQVGDKGMWYRVRVGFYDTREEAMVVMDKLAKANMKGFLIGLDK